MRDNVFDLYTDYLISAFGQTTAVGLSEVLKGAISHDRITRMLSGRLKTAAELWFMVKRIIRRIERDEGVLIIDDSISEKPSTDENDIICWHYDHSKGIRVKGINFMTALYYVEGTALPVSFQLIAKTEYYTDPKDGKTKRRCSVGKNQYCREMIKQAASNRIKFHYVLADVWFASAENMMVIKNEVKKDFVMPVKTNRKIALSADDKKHGRYVRADKIDFRTNTPIKIFLENVDFPMLLVKQVFENKDRSKGIMYLAASDTEMTYEQITTNYRKRWNVEYYHKSLKQNVSLEKSPTQTVTTQTNHFFACLCGYIKLEMCKVSKKLNHFALKTKIYIKALQSSFAQLQKLQTYKIFA